MLAPPESINKKSFTKCKFEKNNIIQYVLYIIRIIILQISKCPISIDILFYFSNNKPIFQNLYVNMNNIPFLWLSLLQIYKIYYFLQIGFFYKNNPRRGEHSQDQ